MIGDLLDQISGKADTGPTSPAQPSKRKAGDDLARAPASKTPRVASTGAGSSARNEPRFSHGSLNVRPKQPPVDPPRSRSVASASSAARAVLSPSRSTTASRPAATTSRPALATNRTKAAPTLTASASQSTPQTAPKKGSYLEIMQRAKAAQASMGQVGKIQHKPVEKGPSKRERMVLQAEDARTAKSRNSKAAARNGRLSTPSRPLASRPSGPRESRTGPNRRPAADAVETKKAGKPTRPSAAARDDKQPKKAASATTGYQGTARPRPSSTTSAAAARSGGGSGAAARPRIPFGEPRRSRYDEDFDEEMDDFIEYDDEEPEADVGRRGRGWSGEDDDESDMEAGMSDIDEEEYLAERTARREDAQQEALERRLKAEKEERKRQALAGTGYRR